LVALAFLLVNMLFALVYVSLGPEALHRDSALVLSSFETAFFFSAQTLTTVGYGAIAPVGTLANAVSTIEVTLGLLGFALVTGLMFARFSRPSGKLVFSDRIIVAPYGSGNSLQFRIANLRSSVMAEVDARILLMTVEPDETGELNRKFVELPLERSNVLFLPLTWTIVHAIDDASPLRGKAQADLERMQAELLILIKGYDDSFSQVVHTRYSYRWDEIQWSARFVPAFRVAPEGHMLLDIAKISETAATQP
jgi:inward rectifier potassium channel